MNRSFLLVTAFAAILLTALAVSWLGQPPSNQEALANLAKGLDYVQGWQSVGGPPWWTPNFMQGSSLAGWLTQAVSGVWLLAWSAVAGIFAGPKIAGFLSLFLGTLGVYFWATRLTAQRWAGAAAALAFLLVPSLYVRLGAVEHMVFISAFAVAPWTLLALTALIQQPSLRHGLLFGAGFSLLLLAYAKAAAILLPLLVVYGAALWLRVHRTWKIPLAPFLAALAAIILLGVLPNLPAVREMKFATVFELAPFAGWQNAFSLKSNLLWLDRDGLLSQGMPDFFNPSTARGGNYLGLLAAVLVVTVLWWRPTGLYASAVGFVFRLAVALALVAHWLSFGPRSILGGQIEFLRFALDIVDVSIALSWLLLAVQPWIIVRLLPRVLPGKVWVGAVLSIVYLAVPGFRLISWLPIYADFRAPHDFYQTGGIFFFALAVGCAAWLLAEALPKRVPQRVLWPAVLLLAVADISPYFRPFLKSPLNRSTFDDFQKAEDFLAQAPRAGWVYPLSGRYFYLLTPHLSGRALTTEAFNSYYTERGMSYLQSSAPLSPTLLQAYLNAGGVGYVFIDKKDPDTSEESKQMFKSLLRTAFENDHFLILENPTAMAPAFLAENFIEGEADPARTAYSALMLEKLGVVVIQREPDDLVIEQGRVGQLKTDGYKLDDKVDKAAMEPFRTLTLATPRARNYQQITVNAPGRPGWVVVPEAYHPDWVATVGNKPAPVLEANGALLAVQVTDPGAPVTLRFVPPWWYNASLGLSATAWVACGLLLTAAPKNLRRRLAEVPSAGPATPPTSDIERAPIKRAVVVIPTYNEAHNLPDILAQVLAADPRIEVLVVDDNSPDGSGDVVREHEAFGRRVHLLPRAGKLGLGSAYRDGFKWAFERVFDACLEMDADLSHNPADIPALLNALDNGADAAVGSRYLGGVRVMNWPEHRLLLSTSASRFVRVATGLPMTDATSGFKAMRTSLLRQLDWKKIRANGYGFQIELHYYLWQAGARLVEVPIVFTERRSGETKMSLGIAIEAALRTIQLALSRKA